MNFFLQKKSFFQRLGPLLCWFIALIFPAQLLAQRQDPATSPADSLNKPYAPSRRPTFRIPDRHGDPFSNFTTESPLFLKDPSRLKLDVDIDTAGNYTIYEKIGDVNYRPASSMSFEEFKRYQDRQQMKNYWRTRSRAQDGESAVSSRSIIPKIFISPVLDRIFGGSYVELVPRGFVTLDFGGQFQKINNPTYSIRQQRNGGFEFDQMINMSVVGKVGEKLAVTANFDNNNSFDFQNNMKVEYTGFKEDILQKLEIGNVSLPLNNTLIQGAQNLFGIKAQLQFGKLNVTTIASTQRGKTSSLNLGGGGGGPGGQGQGQGRPFELISSQYDENRHFFLSHFFRDNYERWVAFTPQINSSVNILRVEVYVLNRNNETQTLRNIVGFIDLGERSKINNPNITPLSTGPASNNSNTLWSQLQPISRSVDGITAELESKLNLNNGVDFEKITSARKLAPSEYTFHPLLGYVTLTRKLQNDEVLAVAYEYTFRGERYQVGELTENYGRLKEDEVIFLKLLRQRNLSTVLRTHPWDLMMKNVYSLGVNQLSMDGFQLRIIYKDDASGVDNPQLQEPVLQDRPLVELLGLDRLNPVNDPQPDGNFDYVEGITVNSANGLIIFPFLEPFGAGLRRSFNNDLRLIRKYSYDTLYRTTKADAELFATRNKFWLKGFYSSAGGSAKEILIPGFGLAPGSIQVFAGGIMLMEGTDYTVDYNFGKVIILNDAILNSGKEIEIKYEQNDPFAFQTRSLVGTRFDYRLNDDVNFGSTFLYYNERPLITRNQIGTEPARNLQYGVDFNINKKSRVLTKLVDALPLIQTKEPSSFNITGEFAQLIPGTSNKIDGVGTAYIDDFENTATPYSMMNALSWKLSSIPESEEYDFDPTNGAENNVRAGDRRAKLAWYTIDPQLQRQRGPFRPENITDEDLRNHYVRLVAPDEIFPNRQFQQAIFQEPILDLAFYPRERGPYNFRTNLTTNGLIPAAEAEKSWAGITNAIRTEVDFDKANIEYVEFWLLDPFLPGNNGTIEVAPGDVQRNTTGGKLIFQLGSISEDVMRDGKHAFENGLPPDGDFTQSVTKNEWGYVTEQQFITNGFDNSRPGSRQFQDVGLDGVSGELEAQTFLNNFPPSVQPLVRNDPAADNFRHFLDGSYDALNAKVLQRYKDFNGMDGNTPIAANTSVIATASYQNPDNEDLNADNTLNELEEYYEYDIDIAPGKLQVGSEYIADKQTASASGETVTWYLYRIPVREFERLYGGIQGFKSIRYARLILTGWREPVVLRMANFRMVGSRWRRYTENLQGGGLTPDPEPGVENLTVSVVNLEENSEPDPTSNKSGYVIPPGVVRDRDNTSAVPRLLNEQSVQMCVENLEDGDARAIFKNISMDLFNYGRVTMFLHANSQSNDNDMHAFLRLGTDFDENYYEIEIPLKVTRDINDRSERGVWPEENEIDIALDELIRLKGERDRLNFPLTQGYPRTPKQVGKHLIRVFGRPDLSSVQVIMIGVRNPSTSDQRSHSVCIWANELRVTDFNREAGWAISSAVNAKLADFAVISGAIRHTTFGFGGVSSKIFERTREETTSYDVTGNFNMDKFIPGNTGIKIPMYLSYESTRITPQYDPANPDTRTDIMRDVFAGRENEREQYLRLIQDRTVRRSMNFTNVRKVKVKPDAPTHFWDIENFSFSYAFSEASRSSFTTAQGIQKQQRGSVAYQFNPKSTGIEPFKESKSLNSPWLKFVKDFNLNLMPSSLAVRFDLERSFGKIIYRNSIGYNQFSESRPNYLKYFIFNRQYNLRWDLTRNLSLEYNARANANIDEPLGELDTREKRDTVIQRLKNFGRMKNYDQNVVANYKLPLDKFPVTDWVGADYRYQASYGWTAGPVNLPGTRSIPDSLNFRNTIQNGREQNYSARLDLLKLYNKVKFLKELNTPPKPVTPGRTGPAVKQEADTTKKAEVPGAIKGLLRLLMSVKSINGTYTLTEGTELPGFDPTPRLLGMDRNWDSPGWDFILGGQSPMIRKEAASKGWLVKKEALSNLFNQSRVENINARANVEPARDFKIQLDLRKETMDSYSETWRYDPEIDGLPGDKYNGFRSFSPFRSGSYRISTVSIRTAFNKTNGETESEVFRIFEENLGVIEQRFLTNRSEDYDSAQDVLIPAFIAAYTGASVRGISLSPFPSTPLPNWRIDYNGLSRLPVFKDLFQSVTISHSYQSIYAVTNYTSSGEFRNSSRLEIDRRVEDYNEEYFGEKISDPNSADFGNIIPAYIISSVTISEQFNPLIGVNIRTKSRVSANFQYRTKRDVALNISNAQVTELSSRDVTFELGFTRTNMKLPFKSQGRTIVLKNDVVFRMNATVGNTKTIQRKIEELDVVTNGNINFQLRPNVSYNVNQKLMVQLYFERNINEPLISSSARRATTRFGAQIRFNLAQ